MLAENNAALDYFMHYEEEEYPLGKKKQVDKDNQKDLVAKSFDNKSLKDMLSGNISQDELLTSELSWSSRGVRFNEREFPADKLVLDIKYHHPGFQIYNPFIHLIINWIIY